MLLWTRFADGYHQPMSIMNNANEADYPGKLKAVADALVDWDGPVVLTAHVDPDGDALGSTLALKRALESVGKTALLPLEPPPFLAFLCEPGELSDPLDALPDGSMLAVLDVSDLSRMVGAPAEGAAFMLNIDHHGTNDRFGDLALVQPGAAATAQIVKDLIDVLGVVWSERIATPCLTGIMTDTGTFRYTNTTAEVLKAAGDLMAAGAKYTELSDRVQRRPASYFQMLGRVMETLEMHEDGAVSLAYVTQELRAAYGEDDDSDDYVGVIRYIEGVEIAVLLKEKDDAVKISVRARPPYSAQNVAVELGGGGHVAAAGAKLDGLSLNEAKERVVAATQAEVRRQRGR